MALNKLNENITLAVVLHMSPQFKARVWIATRLMVLAAWVLGCGAEIGFDPADAEKEGQDA